MHDSILTEKQATVHAAAVGKTVKTIHSRWSFVEATICSPEQRLVFDRAASDREELGPSVRPFNFDLGCRRRCKNP